MPKSYLRNFLRFQQEPQQDDYLDYMKRRFAEEGIPEENLVRGSSGEVRGARRPGVTMTAIQPPSKMPQRPAAPERGKQRWFDIIPQLLSGAGDVVSARSGQRTNYLGGLMGMQEAGRQQTYEDQLRQAAIGWEEQQRRYADEWQRKGWERQGQEDIFRRAQAERAYGLQERGVKLEEEQLEMLRGQVKAAGEERGRQGDIRKLKIKMLADEISTLGDVEQVDKKYAEAVNALGPEATQEDYDLLQRAAYDAKSALYAKSAKPSWWQKPWFGLVEERKRTGKSYAPTWLDLQSEYGPRQ